MKNLVLEKSARKPLAVSQVLTPGQGHVRLPFLIWLIFISTTLALVGGITIFGFNLTGWGWFIPFVFSILIILRDPMKVNLPLFIWIPWILLVLVYLVLSEFPSLQRSAQLLCPVVIGMAVSSYRLHSYQIEKFVKMLKYVSIGLLSIVVLKTGIYGTGRLPEITGLAPEVMTGMLLCTVYAAAHASGDRKAFFMWSALAAVPIIALTRTAIVATGLTLPFTLGPMKMRRRVALVALFCVLGVALFYSPRIQSKMFYSGKGEMSDILSEDFRSTGRFAMWEQFKTGIGEEPWFGHGLGAGEVFVRRITMGSSGYPHNDWLLTLYDHGIFGTAIYALTLVMASIHAIRKARAASEEGRLLFLAGAASFVPYAMLMYTDNIMVYASFFGDLQFTILGMAYASLSKPLPAGRRIRIRW